MELADQPWFFGEISTQQASNLVSNREDGTFLIRLSSQSGYVAVTRALNGSAVHFRKLLHDRKGFTLGDGKRFETLDEWFEAVRQSLQLGACCARTTGIYNTSPW